MSFYMVTKGMAQVEEIFTGRTKEEVIDNARPMINQWPEYAELENEEIIELTESGRMEFDLVEVQGSYPSASASKSDLIAIYEKQWGGIAP